MKTIWKISFGTIAFAVLHSLLASEKAKAIAAALVGEENRDANYRLFYNAQALLTFSLFLRYSLKLPTRTLYELKGAPALLLRLGQASGLVYAVWAAKHAGISRLLGIEDSRAFKKEKLTPASRTIAQGPELNEQGRLTVSGPYLHNRHPLNFAPLPVFWLTPKMTTSRFAFNVIGTLYLYLGSIHEEARLRSQYGSLYESYLKSGIPFYWPSFKPGLAPRSTSEDKIDRPLVRDLSEVQTNTQGRSL